MPPGDPTERLLPIGRALRAAREKAELSQEDLAYEAGVDRSYVSYLESDYKSPTLDMLAKVCRALGIAVSDLIAKAERSRDS